MKKEFKPFDYPEVIELRSTLFEKLFDESSRGALLVVTYHADEFLKNLIYAFLPSSLSITEKEKLFKYPGTFSSFASKIGKTYEVGLLDKKLYKSLTALREIRNEAAHSPLKMDLFELKERMRKVYDLGSNVPYFINEISSKMLLEIKMTGVKEIIDKTDLSYEEKKDAFMSFFNDKKNIDTLEQQIPYWELLNGISLLCGAILFCRDTKTISTEKSTKWVKFCKTKN